MMKLLSLVVGLIGLWAASAPSAHADIRELGDAQFMVTADILILPNRNTVCFERGIIVDSWDTHGIRCCLSTRATKPHARVLKAESRLIKLSGAMDNGNMKLIDPTLSLLSCDAAITSSNIGIVFGRYLRQLPSKPEVATREEDPRPVRPARPAAAAQIAI